jgi:hypothetical protein
VKKTLVLTVLLLFVFAISGGEIANGQREPRLSSAPKAFQVFYAKFRKAVIAKDKATVVSMTRFPFNYGYDAGDEGTYSKSQFLQSFNNIFGGAEGIAFFKRANPTCHLDGGNFDVVDESDASHHIFENTGAGYGLRRTSLKP